jgi:hypothetical protein
MYRLDDQNSDVRTIVTETRPGGPEERTPADVVATPGQARRGPANSRPPIAIDPQATDAVPSAAVLTPIVTRGTCRMLRAMGYTVLTEFPLRNGRRADVLALGPDGRVLVVEVKTAVSDFRGDAKWPEYRDYCDMFYFAVAMAFPREILPTDCGLIVADAYEAAVLRDGSKHPLHATRRKALTLQFAQIAGSRLYRLQDPDCS